MPEKEAWFLFAADLKAKEIYIYCLIKNSDLRAAKLAKERREMRLEMARLRKEMEGNNSSSQDSIEDRLTKLKELMAFKHTGFWRPMDTLRDKSNLDKMWEEGNAEW